jgi:hypothetical protein
VATYNAPRYNVVVIATDDLNFDAWPRCRRMMSRLDSPGQSVYIPFEYANYALCGPSRYTLFTGRFARHLGAHSHGKAYSDDDDYMRMVEERVRYHYLSWWLKQSGYVCGLFGKYINRWPFELGDFAVPPGWAWSDIVVDDSTLSDLANNTTGAAFRGHDPKLSDNVTIDPTYVCGDHGIAGHWDLSHVDRGHDGPDHFAYWRNLNGVLKFEGNDGLNPSSAPAGWTESGTNPDRGGVTTTSPAKTWTSIGTNQTGRVLGTSYSTDLFSKKLQDWIASVAASASQATPFFAWVGLHAPHRQLLSTDEAYEYGVAWRHRGLSHAAFDETTNISNFVDGPGFNQAAGATWDKKPAWLKATYPNPMPAQGGGTPGPHSPGTAGFNDANVLTMHREQVATWRCMQAVDELVYDLVQLLVATPSPRDPTKTLRDDTVVIVVNDQGYTRGTNRALAKTTPYEPSIRSGMWIRYPGLPASGRPGPLANNQTINDLVSHCDLAPTIAEIAGVKPSHAFDGMSLVPLILDGNTPWRRELRGEFNPTADNNDVPKHAWVIANYPDNNQRYKYVELKASAGTQYVPPPGTGPFAAEDELYDLTADPGETDNLTNSGALARVKSDMQTRLSRLHSV